MEFYSREKLKHVHKRDVYTENYILQLFYYYSILLLEQSTLEENAAFFSIIKLFSICLAYLPNFPAERFSLFWEQNFLYSHTVKKTK